MASSGDSRPKRPNRSAAQRRAQYDRSRLSAFNVLLKMQRSFPHRGAQMPANLMSGIAQLEPSSSPSSSQLPGKAFFTSGPLSQTGMKKYVFKKPLVTSSARDMFSQSAAAQISALDDNFAKITTSIQLLQDNTCNSFLQLTAYLQHLDSYLGAIHASMVMPGPSTAHRLEDLVDSATLERIQATKAKHPANATEDPYMGATSVGGGNVECFDISDEPDSARMDAGATAASRLIQRIAQQTSSSSALPEQPSAAAASAQSNISADFIQLSRDELGKFTVLELKAFLKILGQSQTGRKDVLIEKIIQYRAS